MFALLCGTSSAYAQALSAGKSQFTPKDDDYSLGRSKVEADPEKWAFAVPEHLFDELKSRFALKATSYRLLFMMSQK